jgi:large subunit ribosomal protein L29
MATRHARDFRAMNDLELATELANHHQELFNLRFQHATGQLEDTAALKRAKRDLARTLTVAQQRGIDVERELRRQRDDG